MSVSFIHENRIINKKPQNEFTCFWTRRLIKVTRQFFFSSCLLFQVKTVFAYKMMFNICMYTESKFMRWRRMVLNNVYHCFHMKPAHYKLNASIQVRDSGICWWFPTNSKKLMYFIYKFYKVFRYGMSNNTSWQQWCVQLVCVPVWNVEYMKSECDKQWKSS